MDSNLSQKNYKMFTQSKQKGYTMARKNNGIDVESIIAKARETKSKDSVTVSIRLSKDLYSKFDEICKRENISRRKLFEEFVSEFVNKLNTLDSQF